MKNKHPSVKQLTAEQKQVYNSIKKCIDKKDGSIIVVETLPGTGKSFVLSALAKNYNKTVDFLVFRKDQASDLSLDKIGGYTYLSYNMRHFHLSYQSALRMSDMTFTSNIDVLYKLIQDSLKYTSLSDRNTVETIILDLYTISSPVILLLFYVISVTYGINLIFSGSKMHMGAIHKSNLHNRNNFYIAEILSDLTITSLTKNMRLCDENFKNKLSEFREAIECYKPEGEVKFYFNFRYMLYCMFQSKYFTEESFTNLYMAQYHHDITSRLYRFISYLKFNNILYYMEPYQYWDGMSYGTITMDDKNEKFIPGLVLVTGYKYVYINRVGLHRIVRLEQIIFKDKSIDTLVVRFMNDNRTEKIHRVCLNYYQVLPAYRVWLLESKKKKLDDVTLVHFPLRLYALTYHSALGSTIKNETVELSFESSYPTSTANCIYAGLSCLTNESDIHKIHANRDLLSFIVTNYMEVEKNDKEFYYRCPDDDQNRNLILQYVSMKGFNDYIENIEWVSTESIVEFEKNKSVNYLRIERSIYQQEKKKEKVTSLMKITQFIKENQDEILQVIDEVEQENTEMRNKKKTSKKKNKKPNYRDFQSYIHLEEAYNGWIAAKEKNTK